MQRLSSHSNSVHKPGNQQVSDNRGNDSSQQVPESSGEFIGGLFDRYNKSLVRYLGVKLSSVADAEEVAQEAYARMLKLEEPDTISHMQAYLFKIASNIAIDRMRSNRRQPPFLPLDEVNESLLSPATPIEHSVEISQELKLIRGIVCELPAKCRKAFLMYKFDGRSYSEIADDMHLIESMIRKYVLRAIVYCRSRLDELQVKD